MIEAPTAFDPNRFPYATAALGLNDEARDTLATRMASFREQASPAVAERVARSLRVRGGLLPRWGP